MSKVIVRNDLLKSFQFMNCTYVVKSQKKYMKLHNLISLDYSDYCISNLLRFKRNFNEILLLFEIKLMLSKLEQIKLLFLSILETNYKT